MFHLEITQYESFSLEDMLEWPKPPVFNKLTGFLLGRVPFTQSLPLMRDLSNNVLRSHEPCREEKRSSRNFWKPPVTKFYKITCLEHEILEQNFTSFHSLTLTFSKFQKQATHIYITSCSFKQWNYHLCCILKHKWTSYLSYENENYVGHLV